MSPVGTPYDAMGEWTPPEKGERYDAIQASLEAQHGERERRREVVRERWAQQAAEIVRLVPSVSLRGAIRALDDFPLMRADDSRAVLARLEAITGSAAP